MGNPDGDIIIYEFSDYNCGYCKRLFQTLRLVLAEDGNIALKVKEYPILADSSVVAARAGSLPDAGASLPPFIPA